MCLIRRKSVQSGRTSCGYGRIPRAALVGLLTFFLPVAAAFSVSHALHHFLRHNSATDGHFCLVCSFAKGQVSAAPTVLMSVVVVFYRVEGVRLATIPAFPGCDYRTPPSRAPPQL